MNRGKVVALVQARIDSTRMVEKVRLPLLGQSILRWVVTRVGMSHLVDEVVVVSPDDRFRPLINDCLRPTDERMFIDVPKLSDGRNDVLARMAAAASARQADTVVRICADRPLVDPELIDRTIACYSPRPGGYALNYSHDYNYVRGFGAEVLSNDTLQKLNSLAGTDDDDRHHVTLAAYDRLMFVKGTVGSNSPYSCPSWDLYKSKRYDVDDVEGYEFVKSRVEQFGVGPEDFEDVVQKPGFAFMEV